MVGWRAAGAKSNTGKLSHIYQDIVDAGLGAEDAGRLEDAELAAEEAGRLEDVVLDARARSWTRRTRGAGRTRS